MKKRLLSLLLALALLCALLPPITLTARADDPVYSGSCGAQGDNLTWTFDPNTGTLTIEGSGAMKNFTDWSSYDENNTPWSDLKPSITALSLPTGLTTIGEDAFCECTDLTSVTIPEGVTSIGGHAFYNCFSLSTVTIPASLNKMGYEAFSHYSGLTSDLSSVYISDLASWCGIEFGINANPLYYAHNLYLNGQLLTNLIIPESVTSIGYSAFSRCTGLTSVTFPEELTSIGGNAFSGCIGLTSLTFQGGITSIDDHAFYGCTGLSSVTFCEGLTTIGSYAFSDCTSLNAVTLPMSLISIGIGAFSGCTGLTSVSIPKNVTEIGSRAFYGCTGLTDLSITQGVTYIYYEAFCGCIGLTAVTLPESLTYVGTDVFADCTGLTSVTMYSFGCTISLTNSEHTFGDPTKTTLYGYDNSSIRDYSLRWGYTFVSLGEYTPSNACGQHLIWSFDDDTGVLTIEGSGSMTNYSLQIYKRAPWYSLIDSITSVSLPDGITTIGSYAFYGCTALTECNFPGSLKTIGGNAFINCRSLQSITLQEGLETIGMDAFAGCSSLTNVVIPASVTMLGQSAFTDCDSLTKMVFQGDQAYIDTMEFSTDMEGFDATPEDLSCLETLGPKEQVVVYGPHTGSDGDFHEYGPDWEDEHTLYFDMCPRFFAETCGYTFYATDAFSDVKAGSWYEIPVAWAYGKGITGGVGEGRFGPNKKCTREQVMVFLWAANGSPEPESATNPFKDVKKKDYYYKAVLWAVENGITGGIDDTHFGVGRVCDRAQVVTFLWAAAGSPEPETTENPFTDVKKKDYYYKAVLWAVENGITAGTTPTTFSPRKECTRAQVVTFLYAAYG